jgi:hypothetical protein
MNIAEIEPVTDKEIIDGQENVGPSLFICLLLKAITIQINVITMEIINTI